MRNVNVVYFLGEQTDEDGGQSIKYPVSVRTVQQVQ